MITLYQFALSHYCEKVSWALDHKKVPYRKENILPGFHLLATRKLAKGSSVPVIDDDGRGVRDSTEILNYLEEKYPEFPLGFENPESDRQALEWEEFADEDVGIHLRRFFYFYALEDRAFVTSLLFHGTPKLKRVLMTALFPILKTVMKRKMKINAKTAEASRKRAERAMAKIQAALAGKNYLVGNRFSRADLTVASMLAPLVSPPNHPFKWPQDEALPGPVREFITEHRKDTVLSWVSEIYRKHRRKTIGSNLSA